MDFTGDAKLATFAYELGAQAASQVKLVGWLPGDEFDVVRKESQPWERKAPPPRKKIQPHKPYDTCLCGANDLGQSFRATPFSAAEGELSRVTFHKLFRTDSQAFFTAAWGACFVFSAVAHVAPVPSCELPFAALVSTP